MAAESLINQLLDEISDSGRTPEEVCGAWPELLPEVRRRWRQMCAVEAEIDALFPVAGHGPNSETSPSPQAGADLPRIPGYNVEALLGRGGMGIVYKARHRRLNRPVALKMLIAGAYAGPSERARFQREAEAVASLRHANIVAVYDVGDHSRGESVFLAVWSSSKGAAWAPGPGESTPQPRLSPARRPRAPDHAGRGRAGGAPGWDRAPRS